MGPREHDKACFCFKDLEGIGFLTLNKRRTRLDKMLQENCGSRAFGLTEGIFQGILPLLHANHSS